MTTSKGVARPFRPGDGTRVRGRRTTCSVCSAKLDGQTRGPGTGKCAPCKRDYMRWYHVARKYGISQEEYEARLREQDGRCAHCRKMPDYPLVVDHDHGTGEVRGLLCKPCNVAFGHLGDTEEALERALAYVRRPHGRP